MTTLSARYIKTPRNLYICDMCGRSIVGGYVRLYGMADTEKPWTLRLHTYCVQTAPGRDTKIDAALIQANDDTPDITRDSGGNNDAEDRYMLAHG